MPEDEKKKDRRMRIEEDDEGYTFFIDDSAGFSQHASKIGQGVTLYFIDEGRYVTAFHFAKPDFTFEEVSQWLKEQGFDPSDEQKMQFKGEGKLVYLEDIPSTELQFNEILEEDGGQQWLRCEAIAIAPGTWKDFNFSLESIHNSVFHDGERGTNICEHHSFEEPGDVKGRSLSEENVEEGKKVSFVVFDKDSIRKIKSGFFHSVSSNFLLTIDDNNNVTDISKVFELTLTDNPACEKAIITSSEPMEIENISVTAMEKLTDATADSDTVVAVFTKENENPNPPPSVEESGGTMSEEEKLELEQTSTKLEEANAELEAKNLALEKMNERLEILETEKLELEADKFAEKWVKTEKKIAPCVKNDLRNFYFSLDKEGKKSYEKMLEKMPAVLPADDVGVPLVERTTELEDEEKKLDVDGEIALTQKLLERKRKGQGAFAKENIGFHIGNYDKSSTKISNKPLDELLQGEQ